MLNKISQWLQAVFSHSDTNKLLAIFAVLAVLLWLFLQEIAPLMLALLFAYLLEGVVRKAMRLWYIGRAAAVSVVLAGVLLGLLAALYALPRFLLQLRELGGQLPEISGALDAVITRINSHLPEQAALEKGFVVGKTEEALSFVVQYLLDNTFSFAGNLFAVVLYTVLIPLLVFFMLKDKDEMHAYLRRFIPATPALAGLWRAIDGEFGAYVRGKFLEAAIVGALTWLVFLIFGMNNGFVLALLVGLSVFVPFVGVIAVTVPVLLFAFLQYGWSADFAWVIGLYTIVQIFDGQVLVPLLFAEAVKIHPVAIFSSIVFFGNLWGVVGVFIAIPLAAALKHIINFIFRREDAGASGAGGG